MKPVCYRSATATSYVEGLKDGFMNHSKYSLVSTFLSEINKAISYFIYLDNTLIRKPVNVAQNVSKVVEGKELSVFLMKIDI